MSDDSAKGRSSAQTDIQRPIRVLFVSHDTYMFGAQRTLVTLLSRIDRNVCDPILLVPYDGPMTNSATELGIPVFIEQLVHWIPSVYVSSKKQRLRYIYRFLRTLYPRCRAIERLIVEHGIHVVYTNTVTCVEGAIAAWRTRKPHIWHIHEHILRNNELAPLFPYVLYCAGIKFLSRSIIFCSRVLASGYPRLFEKALIVYSGLPYPPLRDRNVAREEAIKLLGIDPGAKIVAIVGALHPPKDHMTFLAAAEIVTRLVEGAVFLIVGTGPESDIDRMRNRISELQLETVVRLLGWRNDIPDLLAAIDVLVISSEQESFGLTAIEALAMETPVVATRCGGPEEVVEDGVTGLLVPIKDPSAMADAIAKVLLDPILARQIGVNGRKHVLEHFNVDRYVQSIQQVIQEAAVLRNKE